jgi:acetylornithine deacetylase/succinyl-diaminopimelate desuccinylase-like protein
VSAALEAVDFQTLGDEAVALLQTLLRIDTTNAPDRAPNETEAATLLADLLRKEGIEPEIIEPIPGKGNVIARLRGDGSGGPPILLSGHTDVVPADPSRWKHPPFSGAIHDGWIWGRGAIDMKNMVAMEFMAMALLKRLGRPLKRDVIFAGVADEEAGCTWGSLYLADNHPEKLRAEYAISEIGGFTMYSSGRRYYPVQVAEKGMCWMTVRMRGTPGHGSLPNRDNPIPKLAKVAQKLGSCRLPHHRTAVMERFIGSLARSQPLANRLVLHGLLHAPLCGPLLDHVFPDPSLATTFDANLHNTANPTMFRAGEKVNQVPSEATMRIDGRLLPGQTGADLIREIKELLGKDGQDLEFTIDQELPPCTTSPDDALGDRISTLLRRHDPEAAVLHTMIPGFTDAKAWSKLGMKCWGFSPVQLPEGTKFTAMFHGDDERIPEAGYRWGLKVLSELVAELVL